MKKVAKRNLIFAILLAIFLLATPLIALAISWQNYITFTVTDTTGIARTYVPVLTSISGKSLIDSKFLNSSATDSQMQEGASNSVFGMSTDNATLLIPSLLAYQSRTYKLYTGYDPVQATFPVIIGSNGYVSIADAAALELGTDFEIEMKGYFDTSSYAAGKRLVYKEDSFEIYVPKVNYIAARAHDFTNVITQANTAGGSAVEIYGATWLAQTFTPAADFTVSRIGLYLDKSGGVPTGNFTVAIGVTVAGLPYDNVTLISTTVATNSILAGNNWNYFLFNTPITLTNGVMYSIMCSAPTDTVGNTVGWWFDNTNPYAGGTYCTSVNSGSTWASTAGWDHTFYVQSQPYVEGVFASGLHTVIVNGNKDAADELRIYDGVTLKDSEAFGGLTVPSNANDWKLVQGNAVPSMEYYKHSVPLDPAPTLLIYYQPLVIIAGQSYTGGTATFTNGSNQVVGAATSWTSAMVGSLIRYNADSVDPNNVWHVVLSVEDALHLTLVTNYNNPGGGPGAYTIAPRLPDRQGALQDGVITIGANTGMTITIGGITSYESTTSSSVVTGSSNVMKTYDQPGGWLATGTFSGVLTPELIQSFEDAAIAMGMPLPGGGAIHYRNLMLMMMFGVAVAVGLSVLLFTGSIFATIIATLAVLSFGSTTGIIDGLMVVLLAIFCFTAYYLVKQH